jgi:hypothetical protein|uniref:Uncharacterized protein n=2 Tax=Eutreptiella gymnastica TaxID=73025 RepID=A0A6T2FMH9_9EUGL
MTKADFGATQQANYIDAVANASGVASSQVTIVSITEVQTSAKAHFRVQATGVEVATEILAGTASASITTKLADATALNTKLQETGLPQATIKIAPTTVQKTVSPSPSPQILDTGLALTSKAATSLPCLHFLAGCLLATLWYVA